MLTHDDYQIGWICAIFPEMAAGRSMLDAIHPDLPNRRDDRNSYLLGNIGPHNIVIACLPAGVYGTTAATSVAIQMRSSFQHIRFCLMVGVGGGAPRPGADIRLGDVVVSQPTPGYGGVIPYDHGKAVTESQLVPTGTLNKPPEVLLVALSRLQATHALEENRIQVFYNEAIERYPRLGETARYPGKDEDKLFMPGYSHAGPETDCEQCDGSMLHQRPSRSENRTRIFYGLIASANQIMRNAAKRDRLARDHGILCFEMEAAGLMDIFPSLIIRGICDYSDSHKNKQWQGYAAMTAAAYAKELLLTIPFHEVESTPTTLELPVHGPGHDHEIDQAMSESRTKPPSSPSQTETNIDRGTLRTPQTILRPAAGYSTAGESGMLTLFDLDDAPAVPSSGPWAEEFKIEQKQPQSSPDIVKEMDIPNPDLLANPSSQIDSNSSLLKCLSLARRQRSWDPWPGDCVKIFHNLATWLSKLDSTLLVLASDPNVQSRTKDLAVEVADFLDNSAAKTTDDGYMVLWTFSSTCVTERNNDNPTEILKSLIHGVISAYPHHIEPEVSTNPSFGKEELWKLLKAALIKTKRVFVIIEANDPTMTARMLQLAEELVDTPGAMVKFLLVVHPSRSGVKAISHLSPNERKQVVSVSLPPPLSRKLHCLPRHDLRLNDLVPRF
ncbi:hypothetical protein FQN50_002988 [Emmonsiellopsis sp. PD_5]|nr:hypothetical protein FQN50_002988 [Emmonsiellopsis sp. PD_5]